MTKREVEQEIKNLLNNYIKDKKIKNIELYLTKKRSFIYLNEILNIEIYHE